MHVHAADLDWNARVPEVYDFWVPSTHWGQMLAALSPSELDTSGVSMRGGSTLKIETLNGETIRVHVWTVQSPSVGAFGVLPPSSSLYEEYTGGNTMQFLEAVRDAYRARGINVNGPDSANEPLANQE